MQIIDISRTLANDLAPWPGDTPFHFELKWKIAAGATVNVGAVETGFHSGTHTDAVFHFDPKGETIERADLSTFIGPAIVAECDKSCQRSRSRISNDGETRCAMRRGYS